MSRPRRGSEAFPPQTDFQLCDNLIFFDKSMWQGLRFLIEYQKNGGYEQSEYIRHERLIKTVKI